MKRLRTAALAVTVVVAVGTALAWVTRDRQDPSLRFDFAVYGDCRHNDDTHRRICRSIVRTEPKFVLCTGDLVDHGEQEEVWPAFRAITKELRAKCPYYAVMGDHDGPRTGPFAKEFGLERPYYDKVVGDIHFFFL